MLEIFVYAIVALATIVVLAVAAWPQTPVSNPVEWREQTAPLDPADYLGDGDECTCLLTPDNRFNSST